MEKGIVIKSTGSWYTVRTGQGGRLECKLKGRLRTEGIKSTNPVAVGDCVLFERSGQTGSGVISDIEPRKNYIIRKSINLSKQSHIIAANIDCAFLVVTFRLPETPMEFIDRFLVAAGAYSIPVCLVFNKTDLYAPDELEQVKQIEDIYRTIGHRIIETSVKQNSGIAELQHMLQNTTSVMAGLSGTGKSSLINAVDPDLKLKVGDISRYHQSGKHTTTFAEMLELKSGGYIIDTPGIRGFGIIHIEREELYHYFPEIFEISSRCAFYNCLHVNEPGCAVVDAVKAGGVSAGRYRSYLSMMEDTNNKYR